MQWILLAGGLALGAATFLTSAAQPAPGEGAASGKIVGTPWTGESGVRETVAEIMARDAKAERDRKSDITEATPVGRRTAPRRQHPSSPVVSHWPLSGEEVVPLSPQLLGPVNFKAISLRAPNESVYIPPDSMGDVSPTQILAAANGRIKVFDRTGVLGGLNADLDVFFTPAGGAVGVSDPQIRYDRLSGRWFITGITIDLPNSILIAASNGPEITAASSFTFYHFQHDLVGTTPNADTGGFADYDSLGVDRFALYVGTNTFNSDLTAYIGSTGFVVDKADLLSGALTVTAFRQLATASGPGPFAPRGVDNDDPGATHGFFIGVDNVNFGQLAIRRVSDPGGTPSIEPNILLTVPATTYPILVPHLGMANQRRRLDALDDRLFAARIHVNKLTGVASLLTSHNIQVNTACAASSSGGRDGSRWYEIRDFDTTPTLYQAGTLCDPAATNPRFFWIPSLAMSGQGHMALGTSTAGTAFRIDVAAAGRLFDDPLGTVQSFSLTTASSTDYNVQSVDGQRWGDYSATVVDPIDDMTLWTFQEHCDFTDSWGIQAVQLTAPPPAMPSAATPPALCEGVAGASVTLTGTSTSGSGFFDPGPDTGGPGYTRLAASVTGGVAVNGLVFDSPTQITLDVSTMGAATGAMDVTVTNPDGQSRTGIGLLTVVPQPAPPAASNNGPVCAGATLQLSASTVPGATYSWTGPEGFASNLQNPSIPGATAAAAGTYSVTVTVSGCASTPATTSAQVSGEGSGCNDGNACTTGESCQDGVCLGGSPSDADLDSHVDALCGGDDCIDTDPLVWFPPAEVSGLVLSTSSPADPSWSDQGLLVGPGTLYDLVSGDLTETPGIGFSSATCLQSGGGNSYSDTRLDPSVGNGFWYLARARNSCGTGTYGAAPRDAEIPPCP